MQVTECALTMVELAASAHQGNTLGHARAAEVARLLAAPATAMLGHADGAPYKPTLACLYMHPPSMILHMQTFGPSATSHWLATDLLAFWVRPALTCIHCRLCTQNVNAIIDDDCCNRVYLVIL